MVAYTKNFISEVKRDRWGRLFQIHKKNIILGNISFYINDVFFYTFILFP